MNKVQKIDLSQKILNILKTEIKKELPECKILIFGSRVRGNAKKYSDVDIALIDSERIPTKVLMRLVETLNPKIDYAIDIIDYNSVSNEFQKIIDETGVKIED